MTRFQDGSAAGIEIPGVDGPATLEALLDECDRLGIPGPSRVIETRGLGALPEAEIRAMVSCAAERGIGLVASITPRAGRGGSSYAASQHGGRIACRLRGTDQLAFGLEDALRSIELGIRGLLVYDEGLLAALAELRSRGLIPAEVRLKASIALGCANPGHARILAGLGADSLNPVNDLTPGMLASLRRAVELPLDVHLDDGPEAGGPDRLPELADLVAAAAPVFLKCGSGVRDPGPRSWARRLARVLEAWEAECPDQELLEAGSPECAVPARA